MGRAMRIKAFEMKNHTGIDLVQVSDLSDVVVFAGPNGVGKTRLMRALINFFNDPRNQNNIWIEIEATSDAERKEWGKSNLDTHKADDAERLRRTLQRNQKRNKYKSTVLNFDSNRAISNVGAYNFSWDVPDPYEEEVGWNMTLNFLRDRFQDVQHSLFKLVESQRRKIAEKAVAMQAGGQTSMPLDFQDPLAPFKEAFRQLLAPKEMLNLEVRNQTIYYQDKGQKFPIENLSSGEREVVNIVFDFILRNPSDCIVVFDEPELHLHPELSYKLLQTLSAVGARNQFIFCTHSPEIITASIENSVVFLKPVDGSGGNQALLVGRDDETHHALNLLGQSIGIISLGKKLLLIEGNESSLDKQTYGAILKNEFPELVMVPVGGKSAITSFEEVMNRVLSRTIWGVEFFMLCDRDAVYEIGPKSLEMHASKRLRVLPRYHLENYFLNESVLATVFQAMEADRSSWLCDPMKIREKLREIAKDIVPYAVALKLTSAIREEIGNVDIMPKGISGETTLDDLLIAFQSRADSEMKRVQTRLDVSIIKNMASESFSQLSASLKQDDDIWQKELPGRVLLNKFAASAQIKAGRLKTMYLAHSDQNVDPFAEIRKIFNDFRALSC